MNDTPTVEETDEVVDTGTPVETTADSDEAETGLPVDEDADMPEEEDEIGE